MAGCLLHHYREHFAMHSRILIVLLALTAIAAKPVKKPVPVREAAPADRGPQVRVALPNYDEETSTKLQIFLDNNYFGPGKIDGKMGEFFRKALVHYKRVPRNAGNGRGRSMADRPGARDLHELHHSPGSGELRRTHREQAVRAIEAQGNEVWLAPGVRGGAISFRGGISQED